MSAALDGLAVLVVLAGLVTLVVGTILVRAPTLGLAMMLDLWVAARLLRLSGGPSLGRALVAAVVVAVRRLAGAGIRLGAARASWGSSTRARR